MQKWFDEVRLSSHPIAVIGVAFYIREILGNNCVINKWDLKETFGPMYLDYLRELEQSGMLVASTDGSQLTLKIVAPGDSKRERCRAIARKRRTVKGQHEEEIR